MVQYDMKCWISNGGSTPRTAQPRMQIGEPAPDTPYSNGYGAQRSGVLLPRRYLFACALLVSQFSCAHLLASQSVSIGERAHQVEVRPFVEVEESLYQGWSIVHDPGKPMHGVPATDSVVWGNAFGEEPTVGSAIPSPRVTGFQGRRFTSSDRRGIGTFTGELKSSVFTIRGDVIDFLIGGGRYKNRTCLTLYVERGGEFVPARSSTGENNLALRRKRWDVSDVKGSRAYLEIIDHAAIEPQVYGEAANPDENFGFILVDDIRQLDRKGNRVASAEDAAHNFDFERVLQPKFGITSGSITKLAGRAFEQNFTIAGAGKLRWSVHQTAMSPTLSQLDVTWTYTGRTVPGVKLGLTTSLPLTLQECQYYLLPALLYNGNRLGRPSHYLGEDSPEDALTIPGGYSVEDGSNVYGEWVSPQHTMSDAKASVRLDENLATHHLQATYLMPPSVVFGSTANIDEDQRLTLHDGFQLHKVFYIYHGRKQTLPGISNEKQGYGQVLKAAWQNLYSSSPTNPTRSLTDDYDMRLHTLLDPYALTQQVSLDGKTYPIWYVGRWELPVNFDFHQQPFVPDRYFFHYTGFSWSGMLGRVSYTALEDYLKAGDPKAMRLAMNTLDFFADHGMSPIGVLYQVYYSQNGAGSDKVGFGTYAGTGILDMGPLGEELYWYLRSYELLRAHHIAEKKNWLAGVQSSLDNLMRLYPAGDIPGRIDGKTGAASTRHVPLFRWPDDGGPSTMSGFDYLYPKPSEGGPQSFSYLIWAYTSYYSFTHDARYLNYAELLGDQLVSVMKKYGDLGGEEMDWFCVDKRMSHAALAAFNDLYEVTGEEKWRSAAIAAGNAFGSWEYAYNVSFDGYEGLPLNHFNYRTVGGTPVDIAFTTNNLAFDQGATEFIRLWNTTGTRCGSSAPAHYFIRELKALSTMKNEPGSMHIIKGPVI
jgi:hypothetical protein